MDKTTLKETPDKIHQLTSFLEKESSVILAFLFGSRATGRVVTESDWDVGVYFRPYEYMEIETDADYPDEYRIWASIVDILETDHVDFVVLNRARPSLVYTVLTEGIPLVIKNRKLYIDLLCKVSYEAIDWWEFVADYYRISEKATSIPPPEKSRLLEHLRFLENEFSEIEEIKKITARDYFRDSFKRKIIERWVENIAMSLIDIAKIILASHKHEIPSSYKEILRTFGIIYIDEAYGDRISWFALMRNIVVHEYLDIKWRRIKEFVIHAQETVPIFIKKVKDIIRTE